MGFMLRTFVTRPWTGGREEERRNERVELCCHNRWPTAVVNGAVVLEKRIGVLGHTGSVCGNRGK